MRNVRPQAPPTAPHPAPPPMTGGASGVPNASPATASAASAAAHVKRDAGSTKPKRYRVMNGGTIVNGGCRTAIRAGKEITDQQYDIAHLKRQGIKLEPLVDEEDIAPPPIPPEPEPAPVQTPPAAT